MTLKIYQSLGLSWPLKECERGKKCVRVCGWVGKRQRERGGGRGRAKECVCVRERETERERERE